MNSTKEEFKKCRSCGVLKPIEEFYKKWRGKEVYSDECAECTKRRTKQQRERLKNDPQRLELHRSKAREKTKERRKNRSEEQKQKDLQNQYDFVARRRAWIEELKTDCVKCGETRKYLIHWHHVDPSQKEFALSSGCTKSKEKILQESKKCVCLCANCHTEFHHFYGINPIDAVECLKKYLQGDLPNES